MVINLKPTIKQHEAYQALINPEADTVFLGGGAGGGKSWLICESRLINAIRYPGYKSFIGREELKRLMQSTYVTFMKVAKYHNIPEGTFKLNGQYNYIDFANGSRIDLLDLKFLPTDPMYERFGSLEYTDGAIEEAGEVHFLAYDVLKSRIGRHMNKELGLHPTMLVTGNPKNNWTKLEFYKPWKNGTLPKNIVFIQSLYQDNPYTADEYGKQLSSIKDLVTKQRLMFGDWDYDSDVNNLMGYDAITDLFTNTIEESVDKWCIVDVARYGSDRTVISLWKGLDWHDVTVLEQKSLVEIAEKVKEILSREKIPFSHCLIDEDGIGGGVVDILRGVKGFMANRQCFNNRITGKPDNYKNLKTQCAYLLAEFVNTHKIKITWSDTLLSESLIEELEQIKRKDPDKEGKLEIEPKEKIKEVLGRSPDLADTMIMRMYFEYHHPTQATSKLDPVTILLNNPMKNGTQDITTYE